MILIFINSTSLNGQAIPKEEYLEYVPLEYPRLIEQSPASVELHLYGDKNDPNYRDVEPVDGIDDHRHEILHEIALRFAPYLVQNTTSVPMDFKAFMEGRSAFPLYIDTWDVSKADPELVKTETIDFVSLGLSDCQTSDFSSAREAADTALLSKGKNYYTVDTANRDDCKLLALVEEFHPEHPINERFNKAKSSLNQELFKVLYFDYPGEDPKSWREEYESGFTRQLANKYVDFPQNYVHPFIAEFRTTKDRQLLGYEFVLQYWFFYPFNDGGNNHEGDWEHINVIISPKNRVEDFLNAEEIQSILRGEWLSKDNSDEELVIKRLEAYFHHFVFPLDYSRPNVYKPRKEWTKEIEGLVEERFNEKEIWKHIRYLAYLDDKETKINTHPVCFIGADNKGLDQLLSMPGGQNRDSHGTYPFSGMFKDIGPAGATEKISTYIDHREYFRKIARKKENKPPQFKRNNMIGFDKPGRLEIVPDWERVIDLIHSDKKARQEWSWLVLPIYWGYPATESPFAGIVKYVDTGNLPPVGPAFNGGWNRVYGGPGFHVYQPHQLPPVFPVGFQDSFENNLGFLNITYPVFLNLPPLDFAWRIAAYPFRLLLKRQDPVFYPHETIPFRFVGFSAGASWQFLADDFRTLSFNPQQFEPFIASILRHFIFSGADSTTVLTRTEEFEDKNFAPVYQVSFFIGDRFASENSLRNSRTTYGTRFFFNNIAPYEYSADLNFWEYAGSIRYNLATSKLQPFVKLGYGLSWYRLENVTVNGEPLNPPNSEWIRQPSLSPLKNILPNTWHFGGGLEFITLKNYGKIPKGIDLSFRAEYALFIHSLGLDLSQIPLNELRLVFPTLGDVPKGGTVTRHQINATLTIGF
jgi:hypothetical protein